MYLGTRLTKLQFLVSMVFHFIFQTLTVVDVKNIFWRKQRYPKNLETEKKFALKSEPAQKCENKAIFKQKIYS